MKSVRNLLVLVKGVFVKRGSIVTFLLIMLDLVKNTIVTSLNNKS